MEEVNLVFEGVKFMILGMGTVFLFLIVMIGAMILQAKIITKYFPEPQAAPQAPQSQGNSNKSAKVAAAIAAIMHHKKSNV